MKAGGALVAIAILGVVATACSDDPSPVSSDMSSRDITITVAVDGTAERTRVSGYFATPSSQVRLVGGDTFTVVTETTARHLALRDSTFQIDLPPYGGPVSVRLTRPEGRGGDVEARARVAPPFVVRPPDAARASAPLTVTWEGGTRRDFATTLSLTGPCITPQSRPLGLDTGTYTFNAGELEKKGVAARCSVAAKVVKKLDTAVQSATVDFPITP